MTTWQTAYDWQAYHQAARDALHQGDPTRAVGLLEAAIQRAPRQAILRNDLGVALRYAKQDQAAALAFASAVLIDQANADTWHNLGMTKRALGDLAGAEQALLRATQLAERPHSAAALAAIRQQRGA